VGKYLDVAKEVLKLEALALTNAQSKLNEEDFRKIVDIYEYLGQIGGKLFFCGVGKSGYIAQKLASTFSSLGLPSFFLHPVEALHGDLGRTSESDAIVLISKSGTTEEILKLIPFLSAKKNMRIGLLGNTDSKIADECGIVLDCSVEKEACINNQAPTTSSTLAMAIGDALAVIYEHSINLSKENFAINHPGGLLGKSLSYKVKNLMWVKGDCAVVQNKDKLQDVILKMTNKNIGGAAVIDNNGKFQGIVVEGDIRRTFSEEGNQGLETLVENIMNKTPVSISPNDLASHALSLMENRKNQIDILPVLENGKFLGFIRLHDLLKEGFISEN
jgi:arabinose-5-phosphate isomerase